MQRDRRRSSLPLPYLFLSSPLFVFRMRFLLLIRHLHKNDGKEEGGEKIKGREEKQLRRASSEIPSPSTTREKAFVVEWQRNERIREVFWMRESVRISWFAKN